MTDLSLDTAGAIYFIKPVAPLTKASFSAIIRCSFKSEATHIIDEIINNTP